MLFYVFFLVISLIFLEFLSNTIIINMSFRELLVQYIKRNMCVRVCAYVCEVAVCVCVCV